MPKKEEIDRTTVRMAKTMHKDLKQFCLDNGLHEGDAIRLAIAQLLKKHNSGKK